jgi:hypothetical protein
MSLQLYIDSDDADSVILESPIKPVELSVKEKVQLWEKPSSPKEQIRPSTKLKFLDETTYFTFKKDIQEEKTPEFKKLISIACDTQQSIFNFVNALNNDKRLSKYDYKSDEIVMLRNKIKENCMSSVRFKIVEYTLKNYFS